MRIKNDGRSDDNGNKKNVTIFDLHHTSFL